MVNGAICKILGLFVNTLIADEKYSHLNQDKLIVTYSDAIISERKNFFQIFFFSFSKFKVNFVHLKRKDEPHSRCVFELPDSEKRG